MSWLENLYETFENNKALLDEPENPLLPICHTTQQAHIEVVLNGEGEFLRANVVEKEDNTTLVPCTEQSGSRAGIKPVHHPLHDKLQYVAGDFHHYGGKVTRGYAKDPEEPYRNYLKDLEQWTNSKYSHPKLKAIMRYVKKGSLIKDLIDYRILYLADNGKLLEKWVEKGDPPSIFGVLASTQAPYDAFVRWIVEVPGEPIAKTWQDKALIEAWTNYYIDAIDEEDVCYVTGREAALAKFHPAKIRNEGDKAKLISANDTSGFTFRGRFASGDEAAIVSFEVTQKAHNMLRWLIKQQGFRSGDLAIVAWAPSGHKIPDPIEDSLNLFGIEDEPDIPYTAEEFATKLRRKILGFKQDLGEFTNINIIALDSASPGRMSISFYRELWSSTFLKNLEQWHDDFSWKHSYRPKGAYKDFPREYMGAASLYDIAEAAYGIRLTQKLRAKTIERLLPCVIEGQPLPKDILISAVRRAANRVAFSEDWEWRKTLTIACGLYKGSNIKEGYTVALDKKITNRDYLYGRLLAYADNLEGWALKDSEEKRSTNAARVMSRFAERPYSTWRNLELSLRPYIDRLGPKSTKLQNGISEVMCLFSREDFISNRPLSGEFLLGYHCQLMDIWSKGTE